MTWDGFLQIESFELNRVQIVDVGKKSGYTLVFLPGKSYGQRSLVGYSPWGCRVGHIPETEQQQLTLLCLNRRTMYERLLGAYRLSGRVREEGLRLCSCKP